MANDFDLFYLIEGTQHPFRFSVSNSEPVNVDDLRQIIFRRECVDLAPNVDSLILLKVNVDPDCAGVPLPLIQIDKDDDGVEEIHSRKTINEIWREPPPVRRIHIFVTFTKLPEEMQLRREALRAAHRVYYKFWGNDLNNLLQPVPDSNFQFLSKEQIDYLGLKTDFLYSQPVLLVRNEYKVAYPTLRSYKTNPRSGGVVVTGQPGIGKTCFLYYLLLRLLSARETVAFQVNDNFILFQDSGVRIFGTTSIYARRIPTGTWLLTDSCARFEMPCSAFLSTPTSDAWIVQTTSPDRGSWAKWHKERTAHMYWMDVFPLNELNALGTILDLNLKSLRDNYDLWGPSARTCISLMDPDQVGAHILTVASAAYEFTSNVKQFDGLNAALVSHRLFAVKPIEGSRQTVTAEFASRHLLGFVSRAYAERDRAMRLSFYKQISGHAWFSTSAGRIFETHVLIWSRYTSAEKAENCLQCTPAVDASPLLSIPACGKNMEFFSKAEDLKDMVDEHEHRRCLVPVSQTFPTIDAIFITHKSVITVQMTVASKHSAKIVGFDKVYNNLPSSVLAKRQKCHVFLADTEDKANLLRGQKLTDLPKNMVIHVYSSFVSIEELDPMLTQERVQKLEDDREQARRRADEDDTMTQELGSQQMDITA
ncbi:hypothetical protein EDB84DRAFT_1574436 [Lactarius hengduanensis]|nr:hypothetical protein EDB84DRAFT_1574436 [Lactarius hengduanensis]